MRTKVGQTNNEYPLGTFIHLNSDPTLLGQTIILHMLSINNTPSDVTCYLKPIPDSEDYVFNGTQSIRITTTLPKSAIMQ